MASRVNFFDDGSKGVALYGATVRIDLHGRPILVQVVEDVLHRDVLIDDILAQFLTHVGWVTAPILLLLLVIDVAIFRRAMQPVVAASSLAGEIGPDRMELRLPEAAMPLEVLPLVQAVNRALDRLDAGFRAQREFTADAAHELRTPLAILRTQIDMIEDRELAEPLRHDVESMSRLVNQLLEISELDSFFISEGETADLVAIATEVAAFLAPLAVSQGKTFAVTGARRPVRVRGNSDAIARAVRNLAENALAHTARWYDGRARRRGARNNSRARSWSRGTKNRARNIYSIGSGGGTADAAAMPVWVSQSSHASSKCTAPASSSKIARVAGRCSPSAFRPYCPRRRRREQSLRQYAERGLRSALETGQPAAFVVADSLDGRDAIRHHPVWFVRYPLLRARVSFPGVDETRLVTTPAGIGKKG